MSRQPYHIHVIIPCYKDSLTDMKNTLLSALSATMPPGCTRTIFLVDDSQASRLQGASMLGVAAAERPKALRHEDRWVFSGVGRFQRGSWLCCDVHLGWACLQQEVPLRRSCMVASVARQWAALQAHCAPEGHRGRTQFCVLQKACCVPRWWPCSRPRTGWAPKNPWQAAMVPSPVQLCHAAWA